MISLDKAITAAKRHKMICPIYVYSIDEDPGPRAIKITATEDYIDSGEFEAFGGEVLAVVHPDGEVEY